jgi:hypothetical protein
MSAKKTLRASAHDQAWQNGSGYHHRRFIHQCIGRRTAEDEHTL